MKKKQICKLIFHTISFSYSGYGLLCRKDDEDKSSKSLSDPDQVRRQPTMYMIRRAAGENTDNDSRSGSSLASSRSTTISEQHLDGFPLTLRNSRNKTKMNAVWVHPALPSSNIHGPDSNLVDSRTASASGKDSDRIPLTLRNSRNKAGNNIVWVHPSPQFNNIDEHDNKLPSSRSTTISEIQLNLPTPTPRNN